MTVTNNIRLALLDSRRLTGPGMLWSEPGAIIDVSISGVDSTTVVERWQQQLSEIFEQLSWPDTRTAIRFFDTGASLAITGPLDRLYTACEINELAWKLASEVVQGLPSTDLEVLLTPIREQLTEELNPPMLLLQAEAAKHNACFLWDDDEVSIGTGKDTQVWPTLELPSIEQVNWRHMGQIPCALITGTNGKTTSVRLAARVAKASGISAGFTSTDFISVDGRIIERGDFSGPGGARTLLRHPRSEMAFLEVARGGMLRRGLPVERAMAALITNVAEDHLGEYGVNTISELAEAKFIVAKTLDDKNILVLNADDDHSVRHVKNHDFEARICWFSLSRSNPTLLDHLDSGGLCVYVEDSQFVFYDGTKAESVAMVADVPLTLGGAAGHNISNCLGVVGLCKAMGLTTQDIRTGLCSFQNDAVDNPGRANQFDCKGAKFFVDFAHNPHALRAVVSTLKKLPAKRRLVMLGHAGDRSYQDIVNLTLEACDLDPDRIIVTDLPDYLRGRQEGEVSSIILQQLKEMGFPDEKIARAGDPLQGAALSLSWAAEGDLILLLALSHREEITRLLTS